MQLEHLLCGFHLAHECARFDEWYGRHGKAQVLRPHASQLRRRAQVLVAGAAGSIGGEAAVRARDGFDGLTCALQLLSEHGRI